MLFFIFDLFYYIKLLLKIEHIYYQILYIYIYINYQYIVELFVKCFHFHMKRYNVFMLRRTFPKNFNIRYKNKFAIR